MNFKKEIQRILKKKERNMKLPTSSVRGRKDIDLQKVKDKKVDQPISS